MGMNQQALRKSLRVVMDQRKQTEPNPTNNTRAPLAASSSATARSALGNCIGNDGADARHYYKGDHEQDIDKQSQALTKPCLSGLERPEREKAANDEKNGIRRKKVVTQSLHLSLGCHQTEYPDRSKTNPNHCGGNRKQMQREFMLSLFLR